MKDFGDGTRTNGLATLTDGELGASFKSDSVDELDGEGNGVTWHNHLDIGWKGDGSSDIGGTEEELWSVTV